MRADPLKLAVPHATIKQIARAKLGASAVSIAACRGGLFNATYKIGLSDGRNVVLRAAPHPTRDLLGHERHLMRREVAYTGTLRSHHVPAPQILVFDTSRRLIDRNYLIAECMPGTNWFYAQKRLSTRENDRLFGEFGTLARGIHAIENPDGWFGYGPPFPTHRRWSEFIRAHAQSLEEDLAKHTDFAFPAGRGLVSVGEQLASILDQVKKPHLIHGDLWPRNILVEQGITAVLDCDRALWGDPWFDWVMYGYPMRPTFWTAYGREQPKAGPAHARFIFYRVCGATQAALELIVHFRRTGEARKMFDNALRDLALMGKYV